MTDTPTKPESIQLIPAGMMTEEGNARVAKAMAEFEDATAECANAFLVLVDEMGVQAGSILDEHGMPSPHDLARRRKDAQEELLRAVANRPPMKRG